MNMARSLARLVYRRAPLLVSLFVLFFGGLFGAEAQQIPVVTAPDGTVLISVGPAILPPPPPPPPPPTGSIFCPPVDILAATSPTLPALTGKDACYPVMAAAAAYVAAQAPSPAGPWYLRVVGWNRINGGGTANSCLAPGGSCPVSGPVVLPPPAPYDFGPFTDRYSCVYVAVMYAGNRLLPPVSPGGAFVLTGPGVCHQ